MEKKPIVRTVGCELMKNRLLWFYGLSALASFAVFFIFWCTNMFRDRVLSSLELRNGTESYMYWETPIENVLHKVYIFNYTNVQEFESGNATKLRVQELGPYVYQETLTRVNIVLHDNGTLTYQENRSFEWVAGRADDEPVHVPNVPLMTTIAYARDMPFVAKIGLTAILSTLRVKPFIETTAGGFLWGYDDNIFRMAKSFSSLNPRITYDKFGILAMKNGLNAERITMHAGIDDLWQLGMIERIDGMDNRGIWGDERCDKIYGTDGSMFPPYAIIEQNSTLYIYAKEICRNIPFHYDGRVFSHGIPALRYTLEADSFTSTPTKNSCYCTKQAQPDETASEEDPTSSSWSCPPTGIFNASKCNFGSPLLISFPHFYSADRSLLDRIDGLHPRKELHESYIDVHPRLGITASGWTRFQVNLEVRKAAGIPFTGDLKDGSILPLIWVETGVDTINEKAKYTLYKGHYVYNAVEGGFQWCSLIALVLSLGAFLATLKRDHRIEVAAGLQRNASAQNKLIDP